MINSKMEIITVQFFLKKLMLASYTDCKKELEQNESYYKIS